MLRRTMWMWMIWLVSCKGVALAEDPVVTVGAGSYATRRPPQASGPPAKIYATTQARGKIPTNDWWSSVAWLPLSERQYSHPLAVEAVAGGLRVYYPGTNITANKDAIFGFMPGGTSDDLILGHSAQEKFTEAKVHAWSDWFVSVSMAAADRQLLVSYGHGSPFVYARFTNGRPMLALAKTPEVWSGNAKSAVLGITIGKNHYGLFAPTGSTWTGLGTQRLVCETNKDYFSLAVLPDNKPATLALFQKYAYAHVTDTKIAWSFDEKSSNVTTTYQVTTTSHEGNTQGTLLALYPHQWRHSTARPHDAAYESVRGKMKLIEGKAFETTFRFTGVLPGLPKTAATDTDLLESLLLAEIKAKPPAQTDTYFDGKWLGRTASLIPIAEEFGQPKVAAELRARLKSHLEGWLSTSADETAGLFAYDAQWGTLIGYPASFGSDNELNDHHFHYGYFIRAAAEIARTEPEWATADRWGGMIDLLIRDIASADRHDPLFPFLRNFDPYAGHSWASGHARFGDGNNNESSSEAMNAWYGMILWGEFTGNKQTRDLGIYLYTTEMQAIQEYWFDVHNENHFPTFTPSVVTMVWGGKGANGTWFTANPEAVHGINWLPIHGGSLYLGHYPDYVRKNYAALVQENGGTEWDEWADLVWMYQAQVEPAAALDTFQSQRAQAKVEAGNSPTNAYHWITTLQALGTVNRTVTADQPLYAVFDQGQTRIYVAYHNSRKARTIRFSDGFEMTVKSPGCSIQQRKR